MPNNEGGIKTDFNEFCRNHVGSILLSFTLVVGAVVGSAVAFYWSSQITLSNQALANELRSEDNKRDVDTLTANLSEIKDDVGDIKTNVAVILERLE